MDRRKVAILGMVCLVFVMLQFPLKFASGDHSPGATIQTVDIEGYRIEFSSMPITPVASQNARLYFTFQNISTLGEHLALIELNVTAILGEDTTTVIEKLQEDGDLDIPYVFESAGTYTIRIDFQQLEPNEDRPLSVDFTVGVIGDFSRWLLYVGIATVVVIGVAVGILIWRRK